MTDFKYTYVLDIASWTGPSRLSEKPIVYLANAYTPVLFAPNQRVVNSADASVRSPCALNIANVTLVGNTFYGYIQAQRIEGKTVTLTQIDESTGLGRVVYKGVVIYVEATETQVTLTCVEPSLTKSKKLGKVISTIDWPRARLQDVGEFVGIPFGPVERAVLRLVEYNVITQLEEELNEINLTFIVDSVEGLFTGIAYIGEEEITITSITTLTREVVATRSKPTEHPRGEPVYSGNTYAIGVDASGNPSIVTNPRAQDDGMLYPLEAPNAQLVVSGTQIARWLRTPTFKVPTGPNDAVGVEISSNVGSNTIFSQNAFARMAGYEERNFASVRVIGGNVLRGTITHYVRPLGRLKKVLALVDHSGKRNGSNSDNGTLTVTVPSVGSPVFAGLLAATDILDIEFVEIAERKARRAVDVPVPPQTTFGVSVSFDGIVTGGNPNSGFFPNHPFANLIDGSLTNPGILREPEGAGAVGGPVVDITLSVAPPDLPVGATLNAVKLKFRHGGTAEGFTELDANGQGVNMTLFRSGIPVAAGIFPANSVTQVDNLLLHTPVGETIGGHLALYSGRLILNSVFTLALWIGYEVWLEIDYTETTPEGDTGSVTNHFDITPQFGAIPDWEDLTNLVLTLTGDGTNFFDVYHVGVIAIFEPQDLRFPETVVVDITSHFQGDPAELIEKLWSDATLGNQGGAAFVPGCIAVASARLVPEGYTDDVIWKYVEGEELFDVIQELSRETRLRTFLLLSLLNTVYQELKASIPDGSPVLTKQLNLVEDAAVKSSDIEAQLRNKFPVSFDVTMLEGARQSKEFVNAGSITAYGEFLQVTTLNWVHSLVAATKTADALLDRLSDISEDIRFEVGLVDVLSVSLLAQIGLQAGLANYRLVEVQQIEESLDSPIVQVLGRVLRT